MQGETKRSTSFSQARADRSLAMFHNNTREKRMEGIWYFENYKREADKLDDGKKKKKTKSSCGSLKWLACNVQAQLLDLLLFHASSMPTKK